MNNPAWKNLNVKFVLLIFLIGLFLILISTFPIGQSKLLATHTSSSTVTIGARRDICHSIQTGMNRLFVQVSATLNSLSDYPNLFQTDDYNAGFRIEVGDNEMIGIVIASKGVTNDLLGLPAGQVARGIPFLLEFEFISPSSLRLRLNQQQWKYFEGKFTPACNNVKSGEGFTNERRASGVTEIVIYSRSKLFYQRTLMRKVGMLLITCGFFTIGRKSPGDLHT